MEPKKGILFKYLANLKKARVNDIEDDSHDMAIALKLAHDANLLPLTFTNTFTRFLVRLRTQRDLPIDETLLRETFNKIIWSRIMPSPRIRKVVKQWLDGEANLEDLLLPFFYHSKRLKNSEKFRWFARYFRASIARASIDLYAQERAGKPLDFAVTGTPKAADGATPTATPVSPVSAAPTPVQTPQTPPPKVVTAKVSTAQSELDDHKWQWYVDNWNLAPVSFFDELKGALLNLVWFYEGDFTKINQYLSIHTTSTKPFNQWFDKAIQRGPYNPSDIDYAKIIMPKNKVGMDRLDIVQRLVRTGSNHCNVE